MITTVRMKKKSNKSASKKGISARYEEALPSPPVEAASCPEPCEEVAREPYDEELPAACEEIPPPEPFKKENEFEARKRGLTAVKEQPTQPWSPEAIEDEQGIQPELILGQAETSQEVEEQVWIS